jgi:hypothetical protein
MVSSAFGLPFRLDVAFLPVICVNAIISVVRTLFQSCAHPKPLAQFLFYRTTPRPLSDIFFILRRSLVFAERSKTLDNEL